MQKRAEPKIPVCVAMPPALDQQARVAAALEGINRSEFIRRAVVERLGRMTERVQEAQQQEARRPRVSW